MQLSVLAYVVMNVVAQNEEGKKWHNDNISVTYSFFLHISSVQYRLCISYHGYEYSNALSPYDSFLISQKHEHCRPQHLP